MTNNSYYPFTRISKDEVILRDEINGQKEYFDHGDGTVTFYHQPIVTNWYNKLIFNSKEI